jgi:hypothetical protein
MRFRVGRANARRIQSILPVRDESGKANMKRVFLNSIHVPASALIAAALFALAVAAPAMAAPAKAAPTTRTASAPKASAPKAQKPLLDTVAIRKLYLDGDFDQAIEMLETGLKEKRPFDHHDSVFIFKHLGVMYAAKYETRERGKYFMHQLLTVEPTAKILDMYASDMIYMIFKNIQDEFEATRGRMLRAESHVIGNTQTEPDPARKEPDPKGPPTGTGSKGGNAKYLWIGATGVVVTAGVAAFFLLKDGPKATDHQVE